MSSSALSPELEFPESESFSITRVFNAPRDTVYRAFTEIEQLKQWWGPKGFTMFHATLDLRPGGVFHYGLHTPTGQEMWGKWTYLEIRAPEYFSTITCFSDAAGNIARAPFAPSWPLEQISDTAFTILPNGKCSVTMRGRAYKASDEETATFLAARGGMQAGADGTLSQLEAYLATL